MYVLNRLYNFIYSFLFIFFFFRFFAKYLYTIQVSNAFYIHYPVFSISKLFSSTILMDNNGISYVCKIIFIPQGDWTIYAITHS